LLAELESALLELEKNPDDKEQLGRAFRAMHTIKGSGGACEFHDIASFTHQLETVFDRIRGGKARANGDIIGLTLSAKDQIKAMFDRYYRDGSVDEARSGKILAALHEFVPTGVKDAKTTPAKSAAPERRARSATYRIRFHPPSDIFSRDIDPLRLLNELSGLGPCTIVAHTDGIPLLEDLDPESCYTGWDIVLSTDRGMNAVQDVFLFVKNDSKLTIDVIDDEEDFGEEVAYKKIGEILLERGDLSTEELQNVLKRKKRVGEMLVENGVVNPAAVESALNEQQHVRHLRQQRQTTETAASIRVATGKLDSLVNLVGELVTVQARLTQTAQTIGNPGLLSIAEEVERLTGALRENAMNIRMLPIGTTFSKFKRLVRDLSAELGKEVELRTDGAETELDKTVIERLSDPLVHIIRNCIDHGIEPPAARVAAGKPRQGAIHLSAVHSGAHVLIRVADDGAGLDLAAIRAKAIEKGFISPDTELTDQQLRELIFAPGFSTAKTVTGVSGRGVGMEVVKRAIDALRGSIELDSRSGAGTTITLKLPLTLAIIDGFLTRIGPEHFIFPMSLVEECVELTRKELRSANGRRLANVRGEIVPYVRLREHFGTDHDSPDYEQIVITSVDGRRIGVVVDTVVGQHQTVIKSLGKYYKEVDAVSGATILGDGTVALILDVPKIVRLVEQREAKLAGGGDPFI
ncbi:MAG TPA: chemotaxis protein CheA, partial [Nitrospirota bacterium]